MTANPLAEVFGFPIHNDSDLARRYRRHRLCPYNNVVANCTKDKANDPLGVCSVFESEGRPAITCPIRFRQNWVIADHAASFFFPPDAKWTSLTEVRLNDARGKSAGNVDIVLVAYDQHGRVIDFGSLEVQAVYISGNIRRPFEYYMQNPAQHHLMDWSGQHNYPRPDYLSSSRKRLVPQLIFKGGILKSWGKKQAVALHRGFYETLPALDEVPLARADFAWLIYDLVYDSAALSFLLTHWRTVYTQFRPALDQIITPEPGPMDYFVGTLQGKLDAKLENGSDTTALDTLTLADLL